jgi:hypothetical protein
MKWEQDLFNDIRTFTGFDDSDGGAGRIFVPNGWQMPSTEVTDCNRSALLERFLRVRDNCPAILEIGVAREANKDLTTTGIFLKHKRPETKYVGIDIDDKSHLNDPANNVYTIQNNSMDLETNFAKFKEFGIEEFGFIFIDGWHSINAVMIEWEYTTMLTRTGIVGFHDTTQHPGPHYFVKALKKSIWNVEENVCPDDYGIGFAWQK